jgi:bla regulator protein blaR1
MIAEVANHVWQSTVFAVAVGLMTIGFRKNRAQVRYWLWLGASLKFLVPFSLLMSLGNRIEWTPAAQRISAMPAVSFTVDQVSQPFQEMRLLAAATPHGPDWTAVAIFGLWACGFAAIVVMRYRAWRRIRAVVRASTRLGIPAVIEIRSASLESAERLEPGVVGWFRPVLLLPAGVVKRLEPRQLEAIIAHELCHVVRRDNLTAAMHMIVEAIFWFHPLVWWIGARLVEERERACDEAVVRLGNEPRDYAEGILNVCRSYLESPLQCVSGVTGSDLKKRIQAILAGRLARDLTWGKKVALVGAGFVAVTIPIAAGIIKAPGTGARMLAGVPKFEMASIRPCVAFRGGIVPNHYSPGTLLESQCTTLERLIRQAYGLFAHGQWNLTSQLAVTGGPAWTRTDFYEVEAKAAHPENRATLNGPMLQGLLEDRFKLRVHRETREVPVYALTVADGGPKLQRFEGSCIPRDFDKVPTDADCGTTRGYGNGFHMKAATMADLCAFSVFLDRPIVDKTGLAGRFNINMHLDLSAEESRLLNRPRSLPATSNPTVPAPPPIPFDAERAAMNELGLNLEPAQGPGEFLVVDHVERPH